MRVLSKARWKTRFEWGGDLGAPDETYLSSKYDKPVMVHHYPAAVKAFYMKRDPERDEIRAGRGRAGAGRLWRSDRRRRARHFA